MEAGIYGQPIQRTADLMFPLVSGYTTARAFVRLALGTSGNPTSNPVVTEDQVTINYYNTDVTSATFQVYQTDDLVSGPRTTCGAAVTLVGGGMTTVQITPQAHFLEWKCTANGPTQVKAQATSQLTWTLDPIVKSDPLYPGILYNANYPTTYSSFPALPSNDFG